MRHLASLVVFFIFVFCFADFTLGVEMWEFVAGIKEPSIKEISVDLYNEGTIYASSLKTLYRSDDNGKTWRAVFSAKGDANIINFIGISKGGVFLCTDKGLFKSTTGRRDWKRIYKGVGIEENSVLYIAFLKEEILLGTKGGLFVSKDNGATWKKDTGEPGNINIKWISFLDKEIFIAGESGVYKNIDSGWKRIFVTTTQVVEYDSESVDEATSAIRPVNSIFLDNGKIFLATDSGIFVTRDKGDSWDRFTSKGLISQKVKRLLFRDGLYAVTDKGVFVFSEEARAWRALYKGMASNRTHSISLDSKRTIWVATGNGLYRSNRRPGLNLVYGGGSGEQEWDIDEENNLLELFSHEPTIREVQESAIRYAEVHPDKIRGWREAVKKRAWLPELSVGIDDQRSDTYDIYTAVSTHYYITGPDDRTYGWDASLKWDLGDLIWNPSQTSIDVRSKLMVQLRDDILDEITRTYFERRRLQLEACLSPVPLDLKKKLQNELRMQELTADLDALTGGDFTAQLR